MSNSRTATVIGGQGFIGRHLVARLRGRGWDCRVPARNDPLPVEDDMGHVFYCAGLTADYARRPFDTVDAHVCLLNHLLQRGRFESLVYLSSTRLYDSQPAEEGVEEATLVLDPANPRHIYDFSKALGESLCYVAGRGRARVARLSSVYFDHRDEDGFLPSLLRQIIDARSRQGALEIQVDSSPAFARDYVHLDDVLDALILIATQGRSVVYNVASGENVSNGALFEALSAASGYRIVPLRHDDAHPPPRVSISKMKGEFGWRPAAVLEKLVTILGSERTC